MNSELLARNIRKHGIEMTHRAKASHIGSILSSADIVAVLYNDIMNVNPNDPYDSERDRFILSKGHGGAVVYAALVEKGFLDVETLDSYYMNGSYLSGHVSHIQVPGIEFSTGSLGHGCCVGAGMALAAMRKKKKHHVYVLMGDGECNEGSVWEMALFANHFRLANLTVIIDHNKLQGIDTCEKTLELIDLAEKWRSFGWEVVEVDGHNHKELKRAFFLSSHEKPICIVAHTIKGKGVSFMEDEILWHYRDPQGELYEKALQELENLKS